jgi:hypothetical protein
VVEHVMSGKKYVREGYISPNGSLMVRLTSITPWTPEMSKVLNSKIMAGPGFKPRRQRISNTQYGN